MLTAAFEGAPVVELARVWHDLLELIISLVMLGLLGSVIIGFLLKQERFYAGANEMLLTRTQVRQAVGDDAERSARDLRGGRRHLRDDGYVDRVSIDVRQLVSLQKRPGVLRKIAIPPVTLAKNIGSSRTGRRQPHDQRFSGASTWRATNTAAADDSWSYHTITVIDDGLFERESGVQSTSGLMKSTDVYVGQSELHLYLSPAQSATVSAGAAVRFFKKVHYSLLQGRRQALVSRLLRLSHGVAIPVCNTIQPIAGPLRPYVSRTPGARRAALHVLRHHGRGDGDQNALSAASAFCCRAKEREPFNLPGAHRQRSAIRCGSRSGSAIGDEDLYERDDA